MELRKRIDVMCIGPALTVRGGPSRLLGKIKGRFPSHIRFRVVATHSDYTGSDHPERGNRLVQAGVYLRALFTVLFAAIFTRGTIFHVHLSQKGSSLRKGLICIILRVCRCRYLVHSHAAEESLFHEWVPGLVRRAVVWSFGKATCFIALTRHWSAYFQDLFRLSPGQMLLLPNPADLAAVIPDRASRTGLNLLFLGRIGQRKGAFDIIRAFAAVPDPIRRRCRLNLAGDGEVAAARELVESLGCSSQISVLGWVSGDQVSRLLTEADALLLPSRGEGMSIALLEAMGSSLAVVTSTAGGADEFLRSGHNSILVQPGDVPAITAAICELERDIDLRLRLGREARRTMEHFGIDQYVADLTHIWEQVASDASNISTTHVAPPEAVTLHM